MPYWCPLRDYLSTKAIVRDGCDFPLGEDYRVGLTAIVSVNLQQPRFDGSTKERLSNLEVIEFIREEVSRALTAFLRDARTRPRSSPLARRLRVTPV